MSIKAGAPSGSAIKTKPAAKNLYRDGLKTIERARYDAKLALIDGQDPYEISTWSTDVKQLPKVTYPDIVNYLVFAPSPYTLDDLKSYKGLDAYNQFVSGWVRDLSSTVINTKHVITAKVLHSQRLREKPLIPWIIASPTGAIEAAHCNCLAGLGEACSHIGALLFATEGTVSVRDSRTVTQEPAYWLLPTAVKGASYNETRNIDFTSAKTSKRNFSDTVSGLKSPPTAMKPVRKSSAVPEPTDSELQDFYSNLHNAGQKPALLSVIPQFADKYVPKSVNNKFPKVLHDLKDEEFLSANFKLLLEKCSTIDVTITEEQSRCVEEATRGQANSKLWFNFRAGRITASRMKAVCRTEPSNPSQSLIKAMCYPENSKFSTAATKWGCEHEKVALDAFTKEMGKCHENFAILESGLHISTEVPYIAASPDGIATCDCCGQACVEFKCPYCKRFELLGDDTSNSCLGQDDNSKLYLQKDHSYYYQIQTEMGVTKMEVCYFAVWTEKDLHIESVGFNQDLWTDMCSKSRTIFYNAVLPELVGNFYSRLPCKPVLGEVHAKPDSNTTSESQDEQTWCYCDQVESGKMICCDNENCEISWFHYTCLKITCAPKGKWFCPECRRLPQFLRKRKRRNVPNVN